MAKAKKGKKKKATKAEGKASAEEKVSAPLGRVEVILPESKRMEAITTLAKAVLNLSEAVQRDDIKVNMQNFSIMAHTGPAVSVRTQAPMDTAHDGIIRDGASVTFRNGMMHQGRAS